MKFVREDTLHTFKQENINYIRSSFSSIGAFSLNWPYISFAGHDNYLLIANAYESTFLHRIQIANKGKTIKVCETYLTDTKDLFVLVHESDMYKLYKIDLDRSNLRELTTQEYKEFFENGERKYKLEPLLAYTEQKVNLKPIIKM